MTESLIERQKLADDLRALIPVKIGDEWLWLEWYECRPFGEYTEVRHVEN